MNPTYKAHLWIVRLVLLAYALGFLAFYPQVITVEDESGYLAQAKCFAEGRIREPTEDPLTGETKMSLPSRYPAGTSLLIAPLYLAGGLRGAFLFPLLMLVATALLTARWIMEEGRSPLFALPIIGFLPCLILGRVPMSDLPSALFVALGLWLFWRGQAGHRVSWMLSGFTAGLSLLFRETNVLLFAPLFLGALFRRQRNVGALVIGGLLGCTFRLLISAIVFENALYHKPNAFGFGTDVLLPHLLVYGAALLILFPGGLLGALLYRGRRWPELLITTCVFFVFYVFYRYGAQASGFPASLVLGPRFLIPLLPILAFQAAEAAPRWWGQLLDRCSPKQARNLRVGTSVLVRGGVVVLVLASVTVHGALHHWSRKHAQCRDLIYAHTSPGSVIVTDLRATGKYINLLYGERLPVPYQDMAITDVERLAARYEDLFLVVLERSESPYWKRRSAESLAFVEALTLRSVALVNEPLGSHHRLRIWRLHPPLVAPLD